jgi:pyroglutamyl-peptidase
VARILITGFGPFPGAPGNPTMTIVRHLARLPRGKAAGIEKITRLLPTEWRMLEAFAADIRALKPDAVLMFGLAGRRRKITPEARALNRAGPLRLDAAGKVPPSRLLNEGNHQIRNGSIDPVRMSVVLRRAGLPATTSRDAGDYLCNALFWTALDSGVPAIFVHVPRPRRRTLPKDRPKRPRPDMADLLRAGELALGFVARAVR